MAVTVTRTFTADGSGVMSTGSSGIAWCGGGIIADVKIVSSADTSVALVITDAVGTVFSIAATDFTTASGSANQYQKNESNSNFNSLAVQGQLTAAVIGLGSGNVVVTAKIIPS